MIPTIIDFLRFLIRVIAVKQQESPYLDKSEGPEYSELYPIKVHRLNPYKLPFESFFVHLLLMQ